MVDCGTNSSELVDFPEYAVTVANHVARRPQTFGILLCRSGEGMEMVANKVHGIRSALVWNERVARETRNDNDANIIVLPADFLLPAQALACVRRFLSTNYSEVPRYTRRLVALHRIEQEEYVPTI